MKHIHSKHDTSKIKPKPHSPAKSNNTVGFNSEMQWGSTFANQ